ncbi:MAG: heparinase II/III domain-containing protein, partial [Limnochordia bacterium]
SLLWFTPKAGAQFEPTPDILPLDRYFRETEVVTFRSAWNDGKAAFVGMKAGINAAHHNDLDVGTFVFDALGVRWIEALGADDYNMPGYFDYNRGRWNYYRKRPEGRNTIVLNPDGGPGQDLLTDSPARFVYHRFTDGEAVAIADITPAYASQASKVHRGVALFDRRRQLLIQDEITTLKRSEFWSFMHTKAEIAISEGGRIATLTDGDRRMKATILSPPEASWISMPAEPLPGSPNPPEQAVNAGVRKLAVHLTDVTDLRLVVQLTPLEKGVYAPFSPEVIPLDEWSGAENDLWGSLLRVTVEWPTMARDGTVFGQVPVNFVCDEREYADLKAFAVLFNDAVIYQGHAVPEQLTLDTDALDDGVYDLEIRFHLQDGSTVRETIEVKVENFWHLSDKQLPPLFPEGSGWFGKVERSETKDASFGWTYASEDEPLFGDTSRRMREENSSEFLIWEAPWLRSFSIRLYAPTDQLEGVLQLAYSADGSAWEDLPYTVTTQDFSADHSMYFLLVTGETDSGAQAGLFRLTLNPGDLPPSQVQVGHVRLVGRKSALRSD